MGIARRSYNIDEELLTAVKSHAALKRGPFKTMDAIVSHALHSALHQLAAESDRTKLDLGGRIDPRVNHSCFGGLCLNCIHVEECRRGKYDGTYEPS